MRKIIFFTCILFVAGVNVLSQKVGIGTTTPIARLEVKGEGNNPLTNSLVLKNSDGDILLRMRNDGSMDLGYNGTFYDRTLNVGGNGVNFFQTDAILSGSILPQETSLVIYSEFGDDRFVLLQPSWGKVGIGTFVPKAKLHVSKGSSGNIPVSTAAIVVEDDDNVVINLLTPNDNSSAVQFGNVSSSVHGGIIYNHSTVPNGLSFRTNGDTTKMAITDVGDVGIGTISPAAKLEVNGNTNTSGEIQRTSTGAANIVPICYGTLSSAGAIQTGTGNFTVSHTSTGIYEITITSENYFNYGYMTSVTPISASARMSSSDSGGNVLFVYIFNGAGVLVNNAFHFIVYKP